MLALSGGTQQTLRVDAHRSAGVQKESAAPQQQARRSKSQPKPREN
jgi:hypothetical protein